MSDVDFVRRRNTWLGVSTCLFLIPSFWIFFLAAGVICYRSAKKDSNPIAVYFLLLAAVPPFVAKPLPVVGIESLFDINWFRALTILILPIALSRLPKADPKRSKVPDLLLIAYWLWQVGLYFPYQTITQNIRGIFLFALDVYYPYFVLSRVCTQNKEKILEALSVFLVTIFVVSLVGGFESIKFWYLYGDIRSNFDISGGGGYLSRGGLLRAEASTGHALTLGYFCAIGFALALYFSTKLDKKPLWTAAFIAMPWLGLLASQSKGAWVTSLFIALFYALWKPKPAAEIAKVLGVLTVVGVIILALPIRDQVIERLPWIGKLDTGSLDYRSSMNDAMWEIIKSFPLTGTPNALMYLTDFVQGLGIIDFMNLYGYLGVYFGLPGIILFLAPFVYVVKSFLKDKNRLPLQQVDAKLFIGCLTTCIVASLGFASVGGLGGLSEKVTWALLSVACGVIEYRRKTNEY